MAEHIINNESIHIVGVFPTVATLKAVDTALLPQFIWAYVEDTGTGEYYLDLQSALAESLPTIIQPTTGGGRWIKKDNATISPYNLIKKIADASLSPDEILYFNSGFGIDVTLSGGTDTLNIGTSNADVINIGYSSSVVNILGSLTYADVTNLVVTDKLITVNKGGAALTGVSSGFEIEEGGSITGWLTTDGSRNGFEFKAPGATSKGILDFSTLTAIRTLQVPDISGTIALLSDIPSIPVTSVFGRTGDVVALSNDYTFAQIGSKPNTVAGYGISDAVTLTDTQTLTNKMLTSVKLNSIFDTNGVEILRFNPVASSVNWIDLYNANTAAHPKIVANGSDANVNLLLESKGSEGIITINTVTAIRVASGTTAERPSTGINGMVRYNTTTNKIETYENGGWVNIVSAGSGLPAGSNTQVQFNNSGAFGADNNFIWDNSTKRLALGAITPNTKLDILGDISWRRTDSSVTGSNNNVSTAGISYLRFTNNTGPTITGFSNGFDGKILSVTNSGSGTVTIANNSGSSLVANRIVTGTNSNISLIAGASMLLQYDSNATLWRVISQATFSGTPIVSTGVSGRVSYWSGTSALNSNANFLFDTTNGGRLSIGTTSNAANLNIGATATATGINNLAIFTGAAHTNQTLSTEVTDVNFNLARTVQWAAGAIALQRAFLIQSPTYAFVGASTITTAATFAISGAPVAGTNATVTNPFSLLVQAGNSGFQGSIIVTDGSLVSPNTSCLLDLISTSKGLGLMSMTAAQRAAITSPRNGLIVYQNDGTQGVQAYVNGAWVALATGSGSTSIFRTYQFSLTGEANSTSGHLTKASDTANATSNPSGAPTTTAGNPGINNGTIDPYIIPRAASITSLRIKFAGASVSTGTVGTPTVKLRVYRVDYSSRTQLGSDIDITISATGVGTFNNLAGNAFQTAVSGTLAIAVGAGDLIGIEFINQSGSNNGINAISRLFAVLETTE